MIESSRELSKCCKPYNEPCAFTTAASTERHRVTGKLGGTRTDIDEFKTSICVNSGKDHAPSVG